MSFLSEFNGLPLKSLLRSAREGRWSEPPSNLTLSDFATLLSPAAGEHLEALCRRSQYLTQQRFGKVIRLFAPLYLSNEWINNCEYCGFSRDNAIFQVTLSVDEVFREAQSLKVAGFRR